MKIRTGYSFRTAVGMVNEVVDRVKAIGWEHAPICDRGSAFGYVRFRKAALKAGLKPIFGVELQITDLLKDKKSSKDYWAFFAKHDIGDVNRLLQQATDQFFFQPQLNYAQAMATPGLIKITGHAPMLELMEKVPDLYIGMGPSMSRGLYRKAKELGWGDRFIATSDNKFTLIGDKPFYEVLCGFNASGQTYPQHILSDEEWHRSLPWVDYDDRLMATINRNAAMKECTAELKQGTLLKPPTDKTLLQLCIEGAGRLGCNIEDEVYAARLKRELALIEEKKFEDYFFILADLMQWARRQMICGPARGSSCGSLVCYLLEITTIDPIPYGLIFERFIDTTRSDLPDVDIDFSDEKRTMVIQYMIDKYGADRVAALGTVALYQPRSALQESGTALQIPKWRTDKILDSLLERSSGDSRALQALEDTFNETEAGRLLIEEFPEIKIAHRMEGHPRHSSKHAAGILLTNEPITNFVAVDTRTGATHCDKKDAEELNLLKIDALGLTQLAVFEDALEMAGLPMNHLESVPLDDPAAFQVINDGRFSGIFQYNGIALQSIAKQITTAHIEDIISTTALARPGPLATGGTNEWMKRKRGDNPVTYPHPLFEPYLNTTLGIVVYQEQVMEVGRNVGGLSWDDVTALRKAMSKSLGKEFFDRYGDKWKAGAIERGVKPELAEKIWDDLCSYGSWAFNRSHSVAYGIVSYWCCWLKAHHPFEFGAATLQHEMDPSKQIQLLREMKAEGIDYIPVDKFQSTDRWKPAMIDGKRVLLGPVQNVKGIGPKMTKQIMSARHRDEPLGAKADRLLTDPKTPIDSLYPVRDGVARVMPDPTALNIYSSPMEVKDVVVTGQDYEAMIFAVVKQIKPRDENELVNIAKRGYKIEGPDTRSLNMWFRDDTDSIFCKIGRRDYRSMGIDVIERGKAGKALYAVKGNVPADFRMIFVRKIRYLGDMDSTIFENKDGITKKLSAGEQTND